MKDLLLLNYTVSWMVAFTFWYCMLVSMYLIVMITSNSCERKGLIAY